VNDPVLAGLEAVGAGLLFGLSAGLAPGPLLALVIAQTLRHGLGHGVRVALAPLLTDLPIIVAAVLLVGTAATTGPLPALIALFGAAFVLALALDTWRARPPGKEAAAAEPRSWTRGIAVNLLSPHPYLFWLAVGAPTLLGAVDRGGPAAGAGFLAGFYGGLVGAKVGVAIATSRARGSVTGRGYRATMRVLAVLLAAFAAGLLIEAVTLLRG
jgi:threonine/homoserine/homoserine lactone efflux protein